MFKHKVQIGWNDWHVDIDLDGWSNAWRGNGLSYHLECRHINVKNVNRHISKLSRNFINYFRRINIYICAYSATHVYRNSFRRRSNFDPINPIYRHRRRQFNHMHAIISRSLPRSNATSRNFNRVNTRYITFSNLYSCYLFIFLFSSFLPNPFISFFGKEMPLGITTHAPKSQ